MVFNDAELSAEILGVQRDARMTINRKWVRSGKKSP